MIIAIIGPTGVGKTKLSIELAKKYKAIIINCDAMQVYKGLNIGTAKIKEEEKEGVPHYLLDFVDVNQNYTVYDYQKDARKILEEKKGQNIILVGGTGLYLKALLYDYQFKEEKKDDSLEEKTTEELVRLCYQKDPNCNIDQNNKRRLIRFLKREEEPPKAKELYPAIIIGLTTNRKELYERINKRVDQMMEEGLLEEVKKFHDQKIYSKAIMTAIGYKELYDYLDKKCSLEESIEKIKQNSRHYAKRQYTFFRNQLPVNWFETDYENFNNTLEAVQKFIDVQKKAKKKIE